MRVEKYLLNKPAKLISRRQTTAQRPNIAQRNIPTGARGRRRSTPILFLGLTPNLDGNVLKPTPPRRQSASS